MCDIKWNALAEFQFSKANPSEETIYCLCSRVFTWKPFFVNDQQNQSQDSLSDDNNGPQKRFHSDEEFVSECVKEYSSRLTKPANVQIDNCDNLAWNDYWAVNGERLIWESWIAKYSSYINPEYTQSLYDPTTPSKQSSFEKPESTSSLKLSFDSISPRQDSSDYSVTLECSISQNPVAQKSEIVEKNRMLVRNLSGSDSYDKLNREGEGWNPLSPISNECETEVERLITSRCGSRTGSSSRTVDSMTNVTHMTVSSIDLSESSKNSESFSSLSSVQSSLTSTSSEEIEETTSHDQQWNELWLNHYEQEYIGHYKKFTQSAELKQSDPLFNHNGDTNGPKTLETNLVCKIPLSNNYDKNQIVPSNNTLNTDTNLLSSILNLMKMDEDNTKNKSNVLHLSLDEDYAANDDELHQMHFMGLPTNFGAYKGVTNSKNSNFDKKSEKTNKGRIKAAFKLMGLQFYESNGEALDGSFNYKMKNITRQNETLKLNKHIRFDDNGIAIPEQEVTVQNSLQDELLGTIPSSSTEEEVDRTPYDVKNHKNNRNIKMKKKRKIKLMLPSEIMGNPKLEKYWHRRYSLFSKFDEGIKLDEESWYSVTPEQIAKNTAQRLQCDIAIDAFCGAGGNAIQLAFTCNKVIAIDIDEKKINFARHNAEVYNVANRIEFIVGDFFHLADSIKGDVIFLSPPWGGIQYLSKPVYDLEFLQPQPFETLIKTARKITENVCLFLPRNSNTHPLIMAAGPGHKVELEQNFLNKKLVALSAYYGNLIKHA